MPYVAPRYYLTLLFCGRRKCFPYFGSYCMAIQVGDFTVCDRHQSEEIIRSVEIQIGDKNDVVSSQSSQAKS